MLFFLFIGLAAFLCSEAERVRDTICTTMDCTELCELFIVISPADVLLKVEQAFSIYSSGGYYVLQSETCLRYAQLVTLLITPVKFH
jgi:hypothetical protein